MQIFKNQRGNLVDVDFRFVVFGAGFLTGWSRTRALTGLTFAGNYVAHARLAIALSDVFVLAIVETKLVFIERAHRHSDRALAIREDDRFIRNDRTEVLADRFLDALFVALLVDDAFALQ